jgi:hypothetical protein
MMITGIKLGTISSAETVTNPFPQAKMFSVLYLLPIEDHFVHRLAAELTEERSKPFAHALERR